MNCYFVVYTDLIYMLIMSLIVWRYNQKMRQGSGTFVRKSIVVLFKNGMLCVFGFLSFGLFWGIAVIVAAGGYNREIGMCDPSSSILDMGYIPIGWIVALSGSLALRTIRDSYTKDPAL